MTDRPTLNVGTELRNGKTVYRVVFTHPDTGKRVPRRWADEGAADAFAAAAETFGLAAALAFDDANRNADATGKVVGGSAEPFGKYAARYIERRRNLADNSRRIYRSRLAYINASPLARVPLRDVKPDHLDTFVTHLAATPSARGGMLSTRTQSQAMDFVRMVLKDAHARRDVEHNPALVVESIDITDALEPVILTQSDFDSIAAHLEPAHVAFFTFMLYSGCRIGEAGALKWAHLEPDPLDPGTYLVNVVDGKGPNGVRTTTVPAWLIESVITPGVAPHDSVFPERGRGWHYTWNRAVNRAQKPVHATAAGYPVLMCEPRPHDLRHTHAVRLLTDPESGLNIIAISKRLGHSDPSITAKYYAHFSNVEVGSLGRRAAAAMFVPAAYATGRDRLKVVS